MANLRVRSALGAALGALVLLGALGCGSDDIGSSTSDVREDRDRTCPGGCAEGRVCDEVAQECIDEPALPQILSPVSGARTTGRPAMEWTTSATDAVVEICRDRACTDVVARLEGVDGAELPEPLARGSYFVRGFGRTRQPAGHLVEGATSTPLRVIRSNGRDVANLQPLGLAPDFDADGKADVLRTVDSALRVRLGAGGSASVSGGWFFNGVGDAAFTSEAVPTLDLDGDGRTEILTVKQLRVSRGYYGSPLPANPIRLLRYELDDDRKLALSQSIDVPIPDGQGYFQLLSLGDLDRDGFGDVAMARTLPVRMECPQYGGTVTYDTGFELEILYGGPQGLERRGIVRFELPVEEQPFRGGLSVAAVGDVDGDGYPELAVGAQARDPDEGCVAAFQAHFVDVYYGAAHEPYATRGPRLQELSSVTALGDVDGDGLADLGGVRVPTYLHRCAGEYSMGLQEGRIVVHAGGQTRDVWTLPIEEVSGCTNGWTYFYSKFPVEGWLVGGGDLDGDGFDDVLLGSAESHEGTGSGAERCWSTGGRVRTFYGSAEGLSAAPVQVLAGPGGSAAPFPSPASFLGDWQQGGGDEVLLGSAGYRTSPEYAAAEVPPRRDVFSGPRGALAITGQL